MTAETRKALDELIEATGKTEDEILAGSVTMYAIIRQIFWSRGDPWRASE